MEKCPLQPCSFGRGQLSVANGAVDLWTCVSCVFLTSPGQCRAGPASVSKVRNTSSGRLLPEPYRRVAMSSGRYTAPSIPESEEELETGAARPGQSDSRRAGPVTGAGSSWSTLPPRNRETPLEPGQGHDASNAPWKSMARRPGFNVLTHWAFLGRLEAASG